MPEPRKVVIVGGVAGGATAAARLRRLTETAEITIFERGPFVSFANCGLPYYIGDVIQKESDLLLASPELFKSRFNIDVKINHEVVRVNAKDKTILVKSASGEMEVPYDTLVLATGASPIRPPLKNIDADGIFALRTIPDSAAIKAYVAAKQVKHAVIVGGGFIGIEMTENLVGLGIKVEVIEGTTQIMPPFDAEMVQDAQREMKAKGVVIHFNEFVSGFETGDKITVETRSGKKVATEMVVLAIGVRPDVSLAKSAGLQIGELGGIVVDETMRTSDPNIYAVGDSVQVTDFVTKKPTLVPLANPANRQARVAADAIASANSSSKYRGVQGTAVCKIFDVVLACTGASEKTLRRHAIPFEKVYIHPFNHVSYYPGATRLALKLLFNPSSGLVLGAQCSGTQGVEKRIDVLATAIQSHQTVFDLEEAELCYAPQFGAAKDPINLAGMVAANIVRGDAPVIHWDAAVDGQIVDVRNVGETKSGMAPGAVNIPLHELRARFGELKKDEKVSVYCAIGQRGYYATRLLRLNGFDARNVSGGMSTFKNLTPQL